MWTVTSTGVAQPSAPTLTPTTLHEALQALPSDAHWALQCLNIHDNGAALAQAIIEHAAVSGSDGSLKLGLGTAAFALQSAAAMNDIKGANLVPGPIREGDSHRCEMAGLYAIILLVHTVCKHYGITQGAMLVTCDNKHALRTLRPGYIPDPQEPNFDLVLATWTLLQELPITVSGQHVKGHQDDHKMYFLLDRYGQLNVDMDHHAKKYWQEVALSDRHTGVPQPASCQIYKEGWQLWNGDEKITHPSANSLYGIIQDPITQSWWVRHGHSTWEAQQLIDWDATEEHMHQLPLNKRRGVTKLASENCGAHATQLIRLSKPCLELKH